MPSTSGIEYAPVRACSSVRPIAFGSPAAMPAKIKSEMPLPRPRSVICSPSHMRNIVPVTSVTAVIRRKGRPGAVTRPACASSAIEMPSAWKNARPSVA